MKKYSQFYVYLVMLYVSCILIANIAAFKVVEVFNITVAAGTLVFPVSYILGDIFSEVYGFKSTKKVIIMGFLCNALMILTFLIAIKLPYPNYFINQEAFETVLGSTPRMFLASICGYLVGGLSNSYLMSYIKEHSKIKFLWFRTISSTIVGEILDTTIFLFIGFIGSIPNENLINMIICQAVVKIVFEIIMTPMLYKSINIVRKKEDLV